MQILGGAGGGGEGWETRCIMVFVKMVNSFIFIFLFYFISFAKKKRTNKRKERLQGHRNSCGQLQRVQILKKKKNLKSPAIQEKLLTATYIPLTSLVFSVRTVNYGPSFFSSIYGPGAKRADHKSMEKNEDP